MHVLELDLGLGRVFWAVQAQPRDVGSDVRQGARQHNGGSRTETGSCISSVSIPWGTQVNLILPAVRSCLW
jgi:hypothetical protein